MSDCDSEQSGRISENSQYRDYEKDLKLSKEFSLQVIFSFLFDGWFVCMEFYDPVRITQSTLCRASLIGPLAS